VFVKVGSMKLTKLQTPLPDHPPGHYLELT